MHKKNHCALDKLVVSSDKTMLSSSLAAPALLRRLGVLSKNIVLLIPAVKRIVRISHEIVKAGRFKLGFFCIDMFLRFL
jgi:hypothetical protein